MKNEKELKMEVPPKDLSSWKRKIKNVIPDPTKSCGPYRLSASRQHYSRFPPADYEFVGHDTITMAVVDAKGHVSAGSSTNGLDHKIPGRVGDSPLPGAGVYADAKVGAGIATGDGDIMQRFLPSFLVVEMMRNGVSPSQAVYAAVKRISEFYPNFSGAVVAVNKKGTFAAACSGMDKFPFSVSNLLLKKNRVFWISCMH